MQKLKIINWPVEDGRYKIGNPQSAVAVCTEATVEGINIDLAKVAIIGKCVTENIGIEKVVKNIVSNPNIRFLILCGKKSHGHDVGQTLMALQKNGVDRGMKIVGATGSIPVVKHLETDEIHRFQKQIMPVDLQGEVNSDKISFKVEQCLRQDPGVFTGQVMKIKKLKENELIKCVQAVANKKFSADPTGSFQIQINQKENLIICRHYNKKLELDAQINGQEAKAICETVIRMKLIGQFSDSLGHLSYLSRELERAEIALRNGLEYVQDKPLQPVILASEARPESDSGQARMTKPKNDEFGW